MPSYRSSPSYGGTDSTPAVLLAAVARTVRYDTLPPDAKSEMRIITTHTRIDHPFPILIHFTQVARCWGLLISSLLRALESRFANGLRRHSHRQSTATVRLECWLLRLDSSALRSVSSDAVFVVRKSWAKDHKKLHGGTRQ